MLRRALVLSTVVALLLLLLPSFAAGAATLTPAPAGAFTPVNTAPGNQTDPHVSGEWAVYTDFSVNNGQVRYHNLRTGADAAIVTTGGFDALPDISGTTVVFMHSIPGTRAIYAFDIATGGPAVELAPQPVGNRRSAAIGGGTVAWMDFGFDAATGSAEIVAYDLTTGVATRLTNDQLYDRDPEVSPDGSTIVWSKCTSVASGCDVWRAVRGTAGWTVSQLTNTTDDETLPDTNGQVTVYGALRSNEPDIYWQTADGVEHQLVLAGEDRNPNISGNLIAFEHYDASAPVPNYEIYLYDLVTDTLYRLTDTPEDDALDDISVAADGTVRVVWSRLDAAGDQNVYAYTFQLPSADTTPPVLQLPAPITVDATSAAGAMVTYTATATDNADPQPVVACAPPPGSTFPIGTTTVTCTATDASGNRATGGFAVRVKGAGEQLSDLVALVQGFNLKQGIANSLDVKLQDAQNALNAANAGDRATACTLLGAFSNEVQAQSGKALTADQANQLLASARRIAVVLGCA